MTTPTKTESKTPQVDAFLADRDNFDQSGVWFQQVWTKKLADFARSLELKLAGAETRISDLVESWNHEHRALCAASAAMAAATEAAQAMEKDKERLDWLISRGAYLSHSRDGEVCNVWMRWDDEGQDGGPVEGYPQKCYHDAREAIDRAAIAQARGDKA